MAFCGKCGNEINGGKFCGKCGASVEGVVSPVISNSVNVINGPTLPRDNAGLWGFILGLLGITSCCGLTSIPALICSIVSMNNVKKGVVDATNKWMGIAGLILGIIGTLIIFVYILYFVIMFAYVASY